MKDYNTPTLKLTLFASDESIIASKPAGEGSGETPEESLPQSEIKPTPENPFPTN